MARKLGYLVVEGPHDEAFAIQLIRAARADLSCVERIEWLDKTLQALVPDKFPHGGDLLKRVPVPTFLQNDELAIAIHSAGGDSKIDTTSAGRLLYATSGIFLRFSIKGSHDR